MQLSFEMELYLADFSIWAKTGKTRIKCRFGWTVFRWRQIRKADGWFEL